MSRTRNRTEVGCSGFRRAANAFPIRIGAWHTRPIYLAALRLVYDHSRRRFARLKLRTHFLQARSKRVNLLLVLGVCSSELLRELLHFTVRVKELVEQHRV